jgi:hypothetical protein
MNPTKRNVSVLAFVATMFSAAGLISQTTKTPSRNSPINAADALS